MIPQVETYLPDLMLFVDALGDAVARSELDSPEGMAERVRAFFTPDRMDQVEAVIPGWRNMAAYADGATLVHVLTALTALMVCPEYEAASPEQQVLAKWIVLLHDLAKEIEPGKRDFTHGFRSAALTGKVLPRLGFALQNDDASALDAWVTLTSTAITSHLETGRAIQDNHTVPDILAGIDDLFGAQTPAALIVKTVLLHMSIDVLVDWPQAAPFTEGEIQRVIDGELLPLVQIMMHVDNDAWHFFDPVTKARYRQETQAVFERVKSLVFATPPREAQRASPPHALWRGGKP